MDPKFELSDTTYSYPEINPNNFQTLITGKYEFNELAAPIRENLPIKGEYYTHQQLNHRYLNNYDKLLIMARAGTGKTGSVIGFTELNKRAIFAGLANYINDYVRPQKTHIDKIYILVKGKAIASEIIKQIICNYSKPGDYITEHALAAANSHTQFTRINNEIRKYYEIITYTKFYKYVSNNFTSDESIIKHLSNKMFIIDEIQNIRIDEITQTLDADFNADLTTLADFTETKKKKPLRKEEIHKLLHKVFHLVKHSKIVLMSASPAVNTPLEIPTIMNLLLPLDNQMDISVDYVNMPLQEIKKYFEGYITYISEQESFSKPVIEGQSLYTIFDVVHPGQPRPYASQLTLYLDKLSDFQKQVYESIVDKSERFFINKRKALILTYPDGSYGAVGFKKYIRYDKPNSRYFLTDELRDALTKYGIATFSAKIASIIQNIEKAEGCCFIYVDFVIEGAIILMLILEFYGYLNYEGNANTFTDASGQSSQPFCTSKNEYNINIQPAKRFAILSEKKPEAVLALYNSSQNWEGKYLKVLIGTPRSREGISLSNVISVDIVGPGWNEANTYQAIFRAFRVDSNKIRLEKLQERAQNLALSQGKSVEEVIKAVNDVKIEVKIRIHCAVIINQENYIPTNAFENILKIFKQKALEANRDSTNLIKNPDGGHIYININVKDGVITNVKTLKVNYKPTADVEIATLAERKHIEIAMVQRKMKQCAIDAQIHYNRNMPNDKDYSAKCDYNVCNFETCDLAPTEIDYSSYQVLYTDKLRDKYINMIITYFTTHSYITYDELFDLIEIEENPKLLNIHKLTMIKAVNYIITQKIYVYNKYGIKSLLYTQDNAIFITNNSNGNLLDTHYNDNLIITEKVGLSDVLENMSQPYQKLLMFKLSKTIPYSEEFKKLYYSLNSNSQIKLLEDDLMKFASEINFNTEGVIGPVMALNEHNYLIMVEPYNEVQAVFSALSNKKASDIIKFKNLTIMDYQRNNPVVYVHKLASKEHKISYGKKIKLPIRIYIPTEYLGWRDVTEYEYIVYEDIFANRISEGDLDIKSSNFYAELINDDLYIIDDKHIKGQKASTIEIIEHAYNLYRLGAPKVETDKFRLDYKEFISAKIQKTLKLDPTSLGDEVLEYLYNYTTYGKAQLIEWEKHYFKEANKLIIKND